MSEKNEARCEHIVKTMERAVCVTDGCRNENAHTINGIRAIMLKECERCQREMEMAARLKDAQAEIRELRGRLATATKALNEAEEKAGATPEPPAYKTGIARWLNAYGSEAKGVGKAVLANLHAQLDGTPEEAIYNMFEENGENE